MGKHCRGGRWALTGESFQPKHPPSFLCFWFQLEFVEKQQGRGKAEAETESSSSAAANGGDSSPRLRQRKQQQPPTTSSKDSLKDSSAAPPPPPRPYTQDQVDAIKDIKRHKDSGDLYSILGLQKSCDEADIKRAYRKVFH